MTQATQIMTATSWFDEMLGSISYEEQKNETIMHYPFFLRVGCVKRRSPRHEFFEYFRDMGMAHIEPLVLGKPMPGGVLAFVFPERWMNVAEQQAFMDLIVKNPSVAKISQVDIITHSPLIVGNCLRSHIRSITFEDDYLYDCHTNASKRPKGK